MESGRKTVYEAGSQVALGLETCADLDDKWFSEGVDWAKEGLPQTICWNSMQQAGYALGLFAVQWQEDYRLWWQGDYSDVLPEEQREGWVGA